MKHYSVDYTKKAVRALKKLAPETQSRIYDWIEEHLEGCEDPRRYGKPLVGDRRGEWRYRVGKYRIVADIEDDRILILVLDVEHRSKVYRLI